MPKTKLEHAAEITALEGYSYQLWEYQASLCQLTVRARRSDEPGHNVHIIFQDVSYIQMPTHWYKGDFELASSDELRMVAMKAGRSDYEKILLFKADTPIALVYVLCGVAGIVRDVEPIY
jgi:hypothetical protein